MTSIWVKVRHIVFWAKSVHINVMISREVHHLRVLHDCIVISLAIIPSLESWAVRIVVVVLDMIPAVYLKGGLIVIPRPVAHAITYPAHVYHVTSSLILTHLAQLVLVILSSYHLLSITVLLLLLQLLSLHSIWELLQKLTSLLCIVYRSPLISNHRLNSTV